MSVPDITLAGWMTRRCERTPHRAAITYESETWTYQQFSDRITACAEQLAAQGVEPGDRVAYLDLNNATFFVTLFATARLGAVFVPLNFRLTGPELQYIVCDAGAKVVVAGRDHRVIIDQISQSLPSVVYIAADEAQDGWQPLAEAPRGTTLPVVNTNPSDVAIVMYTSGTTGRPKGAMLTHANLWWNNTNCLHAFDVLSDDVTLIVMPIFHIGALNTLGLLTLQKGGHAVLMRSFEPQLVLDALVEHRATTMMAVPAAFQALSELEGFDQVDLSRLRLLICGGSPCPVELMHKYLSRDLVMVQGWGMTEAAPVATFLTDDFASKKVGSAGAPVLLTDVRLVSSSGETITESHVQGEAQVRGPNIMKGYWNNPAATAASLSDDGWFSTGDVAYRDDEGFYYIVDRAKDMIISGGENVYPAEVEGALSSHPAIMEIAVIGLPDPRWGETVVAVVVPRDGQTITLDGLREWGQRSLAKYKLPRVLHEVAALPRNATGKVQKFQLRAELGRTLE